MKLNILSTEAYNDQEHDNTDLMTDAVEVLDPETDIVEVNDAAIEKIENCLDATGLAIVSMEELTAITDVMANAGEVGLSPRAAEITQICMENIYDRLGYTNRKDMPSLESFRNIHTAHPATRFAIEGIGEFLSDIWKKIVAIFTKVYNFFKELFTGSMAKAEEHRVEKYTRVLEEEMKELHKKDKSTLPTGMINEFKYLSMFTLPGSPASVTNVEKILSSAIDLLDKMETLSSGYRLYIANIGQVVDEFELGVLRYFNNEALKKRMDAVIIIVEKDLNPTIEKLFNQVDKSKLTDGGKAAFAAHPESKIILSTDYLINGNYVMLFKEPVSGFDAHYYKSEIIFGKADLGSSNDGFKYPDINEFDHIVNLFKELNKKLSDYRDLNEGLLRTLDNLFKRLNHINDQIKHNTSWDADKQAILSAQTKNISDILLSLTNGPVLFAGKVYAETKKTAQFTESFINKVTSFYGLGKKAV